MSVCSSNFSKRTTSKVRIKPPVTIRLQADLVSCIREQCSKEIVARLYQWNTGDLEILWIKETSNCPSYEEVN